VTESEKKQQELASQMFGSRTSGLINDKGETVYEAKGPTKADFKAQVRVGGSKGSTGKQDHTTGKCQFARPCTVGWKSQNQPLKGGGGGRTPP